MNQLPVAWVKEILAKFDEFVRWDRYTDGEDQLHFYGWISRPDLYKDFILITFYLDTKEIWYTTSSAEYDARIYKILEIPEEELTKCQRVEHLFSDLSNVIRLNA